MNIYDYSIKRLENYFEVLGEKKYRAHQVFEWLYRQLVCDFEQMTNIKKAVIEQMKKDFCLEPLELVDVITSTDGTKKYLYQLSDGNLIETVLMNHSYGKSVCVTSQVGCAMKCEFCASGEKGKVRNLTLGEMVGQVLSIQNDSAAEGLRVTNVVVMGIGEPFDNYETVVDFLYVLNYPKGFEIGARHLTVSTCGIVPKIREFASVPLQVNLAISLHASNNKLRSELMPINRAYPIESVIEAVKDYLAITKRRVTFEYILIDGVNDQVKDAFNLANLLRGINCYINLIPYNEVTTNNFRKASKENAQAFFSILRQAGLDATMRVEHGGSIEAACGQLRAKHLKGD